MKPVKGHTARKTPVPTTPEMTDPEQSARFIKAARAAGVDETGEAFGQAFREITETRGSHLILSDYDLSQGPVLMRSNGKPLGLVSAARFPDKLAEYPDLKTALDDFATMPDDERAQVFVIEHRATEKMIMNNADMERWLRLRRNHR